jgi:hypothetical protein
MKTNNFTIKTISCLVAMAVLMFGCHKDAPDHIGFEVYTWDQNDQEAGNAKPILLTSLIDVPAPLATTDAGYIAEVAEVTNRIATATDEERENAAYWGNNPAIRWNEIARELAAKYNLAPAPNPDGTYPVPSALNPGVYPYFPFAHPPYASRMFAYLSAATFDAMICSWKAKYVFNRPPAYSASSDIKPMFGNSTLPSYPSEGAATAGVAKAILSAMFPLEKDFVNQKAEEHKNALLISGYNVKSDIEAGINLGQAVADVFLTRSKSDGMSKAQTSKAVADSIKGVAQAKYGWSFKNFETPERKIGIVPGFGKVKPWSVNDITTIRAPRPPAIDTDEYKEDAEELVNVQNNLTKEQRRIAIFWADGTNTYTPPGHWNRIACDAIISDKMNPVRTARTLAYMNMAIQDAGIACWDTKYEYHYPRPNQQIAGFKSLLGTPNFPGYVSGHSSFSSAAASVLSYIFPTQKSNFEAWAEEASVSRVYGGIHFRFDCTEGIALGARAAAPTILKAQQDGLK